MHNNTVAREDNPDLQLDLGSPCIGDMKEGLHLRIALIFMRHFYFKGIATKAYVAGYGISHVENLLFTFCTLYNYQFYDSYCIFTSIIICKRLRAQSASCCL